MPVASVLVPLPFDKHFDYAIPDGMTVQPGDYVRVPFGSREIYGVVWAISVVSHQSSVVSENTDLFADETKDPHNEASQGGRASLQREQSEQPMRGSVDPQRGNHKKSSLKPLHAVATHLPPMGQAMRDWIDRIAEYTLAPKGMVLKMAISVPDALHPPGVMTLYRLGDLRSSEATTSERRERSMRGAKEPKALSANKLTPARQRIAALLADGYARPIGDIAKEAGVSDSTVRKFAEAGGLVPHEVPIEAALPHYDAHSHAPNLSSAQRNAAQKLGDRLGDGFSVTVLDGVTGSGKTEVYFDTISRLVASCQSPVTSHQSSAGQHNEASQQASPLVARSALGSLRETEVQRRSNNTPQTLILLPEIALSVQWLQRFTKRFGDAPHYWHSGVPLAKKRDTWRAVAQGKAQVVVGARSALFLPFRNLQLIIIDEEHEHSFKQEDGVMYQARDMAVLRGKLEGVPVLLASATPSLETTVNAVQGRYHHLHLPHRHGSAELPEVELVDMRAHRPGAERWISEPLRMRIESTLASGNQAMLFINRRGYAPLVLCRSCGHRFACPHCSAWLVEHKHPPRLQCHHCDFRTPPPEHCPECGAVGEEALVACGPGVERVAAEAARLFPDARIGQMTSDSIATPEAAEKLIHAVADGDINLLVGTQMMAKGHHFPGLALVGVVDADMGLTGGDLRASERCWQLLYQLGGRAGRAEVPGTVLLQTYLPDHPVMQALLSHDREHFMALEQQQREAAKMPPFGRLAALILEGPNEAEVQRFAREIAKTAPQFNGVYVFGPAPAPLAILRGRFRYRLLVKAPREANLSRLLRDWLTPLKAPSNVRLKVDVDPYSFM